MSWALLSAPLLAAACAAPDLGPRPMPPPSGAASPVQIGARSYVVTRTALATAPKGEVMRVYRTHAETFDYSDGLVANAVAAAYCAEFNRGIYAAGSAMFEPMGDWVFPGGCA
jgi:hypothetical protein